MSRLILFLLVMIFISPFQAVTADAQSKSSTKNRKIRAVNVDPLLKSLEYPELMVQPLASERLAMEAKDEVANKWKAFWPFQFSALSTMVASFAADGEYETDADSDRRQSLDDSVQLAQIVGGSFLVGTLAISAFYSPYKRCLDKLPRGNSKRQRLTRERLAEEALYGASSFGWKITTLSVVANLGASIFMASNVNDDNRVYPIFAAAASLTPLLFRSRWIQVSKLHRKYKKRIYGPLSSLQMGPSMVYDRGQNKMVSAVGLSMQF